MKIKTIALSNIFYTIDTYGTFSTDLLDDQWYEESEFDHDKFTKDLAELHANVIGEVLPVAGINSLKVIDVSSPREYNFATDEAELEIDVDLDKLLMLLKTNDNEEKFDKFLHDRFTSYDGFWSYTVNNIKEFYQVLDREHDSWNTDIDHDKTVGILVGWYLNEYHLTEEEYLDGMWGEVNEVMWDSFEQFTSETYDEYMKWREEQKKSAKLMQYIPDIEEWYVDVKQKEEGNANT